MFKAISVATTIVGEIRADQARTEAIERARQPAAMYVKCGACTYGVRCEEAGDCLLVDRHPEAA